MENTAKQHTPSNQNIIPFIPKSTGAKKVNLTLAERLITGALALPILSFAVTKLLKRSPISGIGTLLTGSTMLWRAASGYCPLYKALGFNENLNNMEKEKNKSHNPNATLKANEGVKVEKSVSIQRPASELYEYWKNLENLPLIMRHLRSVSRVAGKKNVSHWVVEAPLGKTVEWDAEIINDHPNELIAWRSLEGSQVDNAGSVRFVETRGGHGTEVRVNLKYDPPGGIAGVALAKIFRKDAETEIEEDLIHFKQLMEAGEIPTVEGQSSARELS